MVVERTAITTTTQSVAYRVAGTDGVTFSSQVDGTDVVITSDDVNVNMNARIRVTSIPALLALLASAQVDAAPAPDPVPVDTTTASVVPDPVVTFPTPDPPAVV